MSRLNLFRSEPLSPFAYPKLDPSRQTFRVFRLLPPKPSIIPGRLGTIRIEILTIDAGSKTSYDALSYVWNTPLDRSGPDRRIIVETASGPFLLHIYPSLELALHSLYASGSTQRPLFADQISINQSDAAEKSSQVQLMRVIYSRCVRTVVCLGPATRASDRFFDYVNDITAEGTLGRVMGPRVAELMTVFDAVMDPSIEVTPDQREDRDELLDMVRRFGPSYPIAGFSDILDRSWFNRLWTIQEACLAPSVVFLCGAKMLCFDCLRAGALFYNIYNSHWVRNLNGAHSRSDLTARNAVFDKTAGFIRIFQERKAIHKLSVRQALYDLVLKYNVNHDKPKIGATLAQDRIFGLLGLVDDNDASAGRVQIDYADIVQTYADVTALLLERSVDALLFAQFPKKTEGLPSWVPDWAMDLTIPLSYSELKVPVFSAGIGPQQLAARFAVDLSTRELSIRGWLLDTLKEVGTQAYKQDIEPHILPRVDYKSAKRTFDEIAQFVKAARSSDVNNKSFDTTRPVESSPAAETPPEAELAVTNGTKADVNDSEHNSVNARRSIHDPGDNGEASDAVDHIDDDHAMCLRICDSGLSHRALTRTLGPPGLARLSAIHSSIAALGLRLIQADETINAHQFSRIFSRSSSTASTPSSSDSKAPTRTVPACLPLILQNLPLRGILLAPLALLAAAKELCQHLVASVRITFAAFWIRYRRRFMKVNLRPSKEHLMKVGVDPDVAYGQDTSAFTDGLLRNQGQRVFRTEGGLVGMGPLGMKAGDSVVIFRGCTAAHIVRGVASAHGEGSGGRYELVGEAYCDGMMDGEALDLADRERDFVLV